LVPRGTESPRATIDQVREPLEAVVEEEVFDAGFDEEQPLARQQSAIRPAIARADRRPPITPSL
jgi:hypothetical protein